MRPSSRITTGECTVSIDVHSCPPMSTNVQGVWMSGACVSPARSTRHRTRNYKRDLCWNHPRHVECYTYVICLKNVRFWKDQPINKHHDVIINMNFAQRSDLLGPTHRIIQVQEVRVSKRLSIPYNLPETKFQQDQTCPK